MRHGYRIYAYITCKDNLMAFEAYIFSIFLPYTFGVYIYTYICVYRDTCSKSARNIVRKIYIKHIF